MLLYSLTVERGPCERRKQKEKRSMEHFAGLDVPVQTSVCIVDETRKIIREGASRFAYSTTCITPVEARAALGRT